MKVTITNLTNGMISLICGTLKGNGDSLRVDVPVEAMAGEVILGQEKFADFYTQLIDMAALGLISYTTVDAIDSMENIIPDPGDGGIIPVDVSGVLSIVTSIGTSMTLARPKHVGQELIICLDTYGGDAVITVEGTINIAGNNTIRLTAARNNIRLTAITVGGVKNWEVSINNNCTLSTVV